MKCTNCNGTGKERKGFYEKTGVNKWEMVWDDVPCEECDGTGEIEVTNEEWFADLTTEEKAMVIVLCCPYEVDWFGENFEKRMEQRLKNFSQSAYGYEKGINKIKEWLKQPHREIGK